MKIIYEKNYKTHYLEIILSQNEFNEFKLNSCYVQEYEEGLIAKKKLNVFLRLKETYEDEDAIEKGEIQRNNLGKYQD